MLMGREWCGKKRRWAVGRFGGGTGWRCKQKRMRPCLHNQNKVKKKREEGPVKSPDVERTGSSHRHRVEAGKACAGSSCRRKREEEECELIPGRRKPERF